MRPFRTMLFAADFSANSQDAFRLAGSLAVENKTRIIVLHVVEPTLVTEEPVAMGQAAIQFFNAVRDEIPRESLRRQLREVYSPNHPIDVEYLIREAEDAAEDILGIADEIGADLIVMGTHGRTGLSRLLIGNVAESVLPKADCPVMVVKTPEHGAPRASSRPAAQAVTIH